MLLVRSESSQAGPPPIHRPSERRAWWGGALLVALLLGATAWLLGRLAGFEYGLDQGIYAVVADVMQEGGAPYRDAWDFKPPGIFFVYSLARGLLGDSMQAVRWLEVAGLVSLVLAFALFARRFVGSVWPGLLGGALAVSGHVWMGFWHTAQPESFGAVLIAWALVLATARGATPRRQALAWAGAGALYTMAAILKPPLGGGFLVSLAFALHTARGESAGAPGDWLRGALRPILAFGSGGALVMLALGSYFVWHDALRDLHVALFVFVPEYTAINYQTGSLPGFLLRSPQLLLLRFSPLNPLGLLLLFALPRLAPREREGAFHVLGVLAMCLLGIALQGRFFAYHYGAAMPLLALLAGLGLWKLTLLFTRFQLGSLALALLIFLLANSVGPKGILPGGFLERVRTIEAGQVQNLPQRRVAAWLRARTAPGDAIYVWGFQPMLYDLAERRPASRFIYNAPQRAPWFSARGRDALMRDLEADPPVAILVESGDVHPGTAGTAIDSATTLKRFTRLARLIERDYDEGTTVDAFKIHLRRSPTR